MNGTAHFDPEEENKAKLAQIDKSLIVWQGNGRNLTTLISRCFSGADCE